MKNIVNPAIISHERFLTRFYYDTDTNKMHENLFVRFGLPKQITVHRNFGEKLYSLVPALERLHIKLLFTDTYRAIEMQKFLYEHWKERTGEEPKFSLANIESAPHPRGIACDCVLTDESGNKLPLPSSSIDFNPEQRNPDFEFKEKTVENTEKIRNRNLLRTLMLCAGISPINKEWFHFQLPQSEDYEPISVEEAHNAVPFLYEEKLSEITFYDIFHEYQNDVFDGKTRYWINNARYFEQFPKISVEAFVAKLRERFYV